MPTDTALADNTRRWIMEDLSDNSEQTFYYLCARMTTGHDVDMVRQGVSDHLDVLEEAGLVLSSRQWSVQGHGVRRRGPHR